MQHRVDLARFERRDQFRREWRGGGAIDHRHFGGDAAPGELADQVGGAILAGKIKQWPCLLYTSRCV